MTPQEALDFLYDEALNSHHYGLSKIIEARKLLQATITMAQHPDRTQHDPIVDGWPLGATHSSLDYDARGDAGREGEGE